jgi:hypothetical protein
MIVSIKSYKSYSSALSYFREMDLEKFKELYFIRDSLNELNEEDKKLIETMNDYDFKEFIIDHLLEFGWCDEDMIEKSLELLENKFILSYDENRDVFDVMELEI